VCDQDIELRVRALRVGEAPPVRPHGPDDDRCPGSGKPGRTFLEYTGLPGWDDMSDLDKGCALLFVWKVDWERSWLYAKENYPCVYRDAEVLRGLDVDDSCRHAKTVTGGHRAIGERLGPDEYERLYGIALEADRAALARRVRGVGS